MPNVIMAMSSASIVVPSAQSITVFTQSTAQVFQVVSGSPSPIGTVTSAQAMFGPFASGATISITTGQLPDYYDVNAAPVIRELIDYKVQRTPIAINAAGAIPASAIASGLISSNSLLGITCTLPTGAAVEAISDFRIDDAFDWCVMAVGLFGFTVGASAGHTIVGSASVGSGTSAGFRTRKTAANTFVTYRIN